MSREWSSIYLLAWLIVAMAMVILLTVAILLLWLVGLANGWWINIALTIGSVIGLMLFVVALIVAVELEGGETRLEDKP